MCFLFDDSFLTAGIRILTTSANNIDPNNTGIPIIAIVARPIDEIVISPVTITSINDAPIASLICFLFVDSFLVAGMILLTTSAKSIEPNNTGIPIIAIAARNTDDTVINPVTATSISDAPIDSLICSLFLERLCTPGIRFSTIFDSNFAPNIAGPPVTAAKVKSIDESNKLPTSGDIFFAIFAPCSISFLFFTSLLDSGINSSITVFKLFTPLDANFAHSDANNNFLITFDNDDAISLTSLIVSFALSKSFSFFFNDEAISNIELVPVNISPNFLIVSFLISLLIFLLTFNNAFTISGAAFISLIIGLSSSSSIFKSSLASLNISDIFLIFSLPKIRSFKEISLSLLNASTSAAIPPPLFCFSKSFIIASATLSEASSPNLATVGILALPCFPISVASLSIAFLIPFVSSSIFSMFLLFIFA